MRIPNGSEAGGLGSERETSALAEAVDRVAHQLKNPLQAMTVNLEVIRLRARKGDADAVDRAAGVVDENIRLVDRRIRMLIALARRSTDEAPGSVDLLELVREAGAAFRLDDREDGLGLRLELPDPGASEPELAVRAREGELLALILAGASGAAEAGSGGGSPYLSVEPEEGGVRLEIGPGGPWRDEAAREEMLAQARRAGGDVRAPDGGGGPEGDGPAPLRVRFPRP